MRYYIYVLVDPDDPMLVRYVGRTLNPKMREQQHSADLSSTAYITTLLQNALTA